jgi:endonuclease III
MTARSDGFHNGSRFSFFLYRLSALIYSTISSFTTTRGGIMFLPKPDALGIITLPNGIIINHRLAHEVFKLPMEAYLSKSKLHSLVSHDTHAPQAIFVPEGLTPGDPWHRIWIAHATGTDRREVSERVYASHKWLWENLSWIYGPGSGSSDDEIERHIRRLTETRSARVPRQLGLFDKDGNPFRDTNGTEAILETEIAQILKKQKVGVPGQSAAYWPRVAKTFYTTFRGDPVEIYRRFATISDILIAKDAKGSDRLDIPGFGPKILSLLALFYAELGLIEMPIDAIPVDVHLQRISEALGVIRFMGTGTPTNEMFEDTLRLLFCEICSENNWSTMDMSHALWFNGKYLCTNCSSNKAVELYCPMYSVCEGALVTKKYFSEGRWDTGGDRKLIGTGTISFLEI